MTLAQDVAETLREECGKGTRSVSDDDHYARQYLETTSFTASESAAVLYEHGAIVTNVRETPDGWNKLWFGRIETIQRNLRLEDRAQPGLYE